MLTPREQMVLSDLKNSLKILLDNIELRLYGSRARGDNEADSDFDLLIVAPGLTKELKDKIRAIVWQTGFDNDMFISALIVDKHDWYETPLRVSPIKKAIEREGLSL